MKAVGASEELNNCTGALAERGERRGGEGTGWDELSWVSEWWELRRW